MALKLIANYSKRLGLPGYSSHQFAITVETEIQSLESVADESGRLYQLLQRSVDADIKHAGFVLANGHGTNGGNPPNGRSHTSDEVLWHCTAAQRDLILKIIADNGVDKAEVESLCRTMFDGLGVRQLEKVEASAFIQELLSRYGEHAVPARQSRYRKSVSTYQRRENGR